MQCHTCRHPDCKDNVSLLQISRLVGCPPFWHRKQMYMLRAIMEGRYSFSSPEWNDISDPPKDLVSSSVQITVYTNIWYQIRESQCNCSDAKILICCDRTELIRILLSLLRDKKIAIKSKIINRVKVYQEI